MKRNKMMRLASVLLIAVLLTTSIISGTFAKYVTEDSATDSARVAKFGVVVNAEGDLFGKTYVSAEEGNTPGSTGTITVKSSSDTEKVVAPGTEGGMTFSISGTPEVMTAVTIKAEYVDNKDIFLAANTYTDVTGAGSSFTLSNKYSPIVWTLTKDGNPVTGCENVSLTAINDYFSNVNNSLKFAPNTNLANEMNKYKLTWKWAFGDDANNKADTVLGDLASGTPTVKKGDSLNDALTADDYNLDISVKITITVAQVD